MMTLRQVAQQARDALMLWSCGRDMDAVKLNDLIVEIDGQLAQPQEPVQEPASKMTAGRAAYFMARFKREEKMLGPNEQAALDFVISMLEAAPAQPSLPPDAETAWKMGYEAGKRDANGVLDLSPPPSPAEPVGIVSHLVKGDVVWQRWPAEMPDGTRLWGEVQP